MAQSVELHVPAGKVTATLTGFVMRIDLSHMPTFWWDDTTADLGNVRVSSGGADVPFDIVSYDRTARTGDLYARVTLTTAATAVQVRTVDGATALPATDTNGRNATWTGDDVIFIGTQMINRRTGSNLTLVGRRFDHTPSWQGDLPREHLQGLTRDAAGKWYVISGDRLRRYSADWELEKTKDNTFEATDLKGVNHLGDPYFYNGEIYSPAETYPSSEYKNQHVTVWDPDTLKFKRSYDISAGQHEVSSMTRNSSNGEWYVSDYTRDNKIWRYDANFNYLGAITLSLPVAATQGIEFYNGYIWVVTGVRGDRTSLYRVTTSGTALLMYDHLDSSIAEGLHVDQSTGTFYWTDQAEKRVYTLTPTTSEIGFGGKGYYTASTSKRTSWTMYVSTSAAQQGAPNASLISYGSNIAANTDRASIVVQGGTGNTARVGIWNSTDEWLVSDYNPSVKRARVVHTQSTTSNRKIYVNGTLRATDTGVAQRPAGTGTTLFIGAEDTDLAEGWRGTINRVRIRNGEQNAAWIAADYQSWESPSTFYQVNLPRDVVATFSSEGKSIVSAVIETVARFSGGGKTSVASVPLYDPKHGPNPRYRYYIADTVTGRLLHELNFTGVTWGRKIRRAGEFGGSVTFTEDNDLADAFWILAPGKASIYIVRDGVPVWGGIINRRDYTITNRTISVSASSFEGYLYRRHVWSSLSYPNTQDQYSVVRNLIAQMQTDFFAEADAGDGITPRPDNASIGLTVDGRNSGRTQDTQTWRGYELPSFGEILENFSNNLGGFEYNIEVSFNPFRTGFSKRLVFRDTPPSQIKEGETYTGTRPGLDENYFEYPGNIVELSYEDTSEDAATRYFVTGKQPEGGEGVELPRPRGVWHNDAYLSTQWPLLEVIESSEHSEVSNQTTLNDYAETYGKRARPPGSTWTVTVNGGKHPYVGTYVPGDWCKLVVTDPFLVQGIESSGEATKTLTKRIAEFTVAVPDVAHIPETVSLTLIDEWDEGEGG